MSTQIYVITNDRYSNKPDEVTFEQLSVMCTENGWDAALTVKSGKIVDQKGETVAIEKEIYEMA